MTRIITTHRQTDFDGFASLVAAKLIYPDSTPVLPQSLNPNVKSFLSIHKDLLPFSDKVKVDLDEVERLVVVDTGNWSRLDIMSGLKEKEGLEIIRWDHHMNGEDIAADVIHCEPVGATITLFSEEIKKRGIRLTPIQATLFLTGVYEDTGSLSFPCTTHRDAYAAAFFLEQRADLSIINKFLSPAYGEKQKTVLFRMLNDAKRFHIKGHSICMATIDLDHHVDSLAIVVKMFKDIVNVDLAFGIFTRKQKKHTRCFVIGRSTVERIHIGALMKSLGGGGHAGAGSAMLKSANPDAVKKMIIDLLEGNSRVSVQISDLMSFPVYSVPPDTPMAKIKMKLEIKGCTGLPIVDNGRLKGMISRRDFNRVKKSSQLKSPVKAFMNTRVKTISPGKSPIHAAKMMVRHDIGRLPVMKDDQLIGIVSRSDVMRYFYDLLPD